MTRFEDEDAWVPVPELITNEQVRAMNELLATPYTNGPVLDYFADEDESQDRAR